MNENVNREIKRWNRKIIGRMKENIHILTKKEQHGLLRAKKHESLESTIKSKNHYNHGDIERISFPFAIHGFFISIGVGRGHKKSNPREKKDWYSFVFDEEMDTLADIVANYQGEKLTLKVFNFLKTK